MTEKEKKLSLGEKVETIRKERQKEFQKLNDKIIASIKNTSSSFWEIIEKPFVIIVEQKKIIIEDVGK